MNLNRHVAVGLLLTAAFLDQGLWNAIATGLLSYLPDIDHVWYYWAKQRFTLNPFEVHGWWMKKTRHARWLVFHIPELWVITFPILYLINPFLIIGYLMHIFMDFGHQTERWQMHRLWR